MKICLTLVLLILLCPGGCPVYDFDLKTVDSSNDLPNDLNVAAQLSSEFEQGLMSLNSNLNLNLKGIDGGDDDTSSYKIDSQYSLIDSNNGLVESDKPNTKFQRECSDDGASSMDTDNFVGSNLFDGIRKKCFSSEDAALLRVRRDFELLIPKDLPKCLLTDNMVSVLMNYFFSGNQVIQRMSDETSKRLTEKAYYDMLGGYLRSHLVPVTKFSFYAGKVNLRTVDNVIALYKQCKSFLNTNGNGWKAPRSNVLNDLRKEKIPPLKISDCGNEREGAEGDSGGNGGAGGGSEDGEGGVPASCIHLEMSSHENCAENNDMIVPLPKLEAESGDGNLGNIWLPFKKKRTYNLKSPKSANIVVKFYENVSRCYKALSKCQDVYNQKFQSWISENIQGHFADEQFYPGLGSILKISENLRKCRKATGSDNSKHNEDDNEINNDGDTFGSKDEEGFTNMGQKALSVHGGGGDGNGEAKQMYGKTDDNWFDKTYDKTMKSRKICEKPKAKIKFTDSIMQRHYLKYICCIVAIILFLLLLVLCCALVSRFRKRRKDTSHKPNSKKGKKKRRNFCERLLCKKKRAEDEEILIKPESKSVIATQPQRRSSTSTSSLACQPPTKCIPCTKRGGKDSERSDAPIIETTSFDYSSSEPEGKPNTAKKTKPKVVTINEKKNASPKQSPRKKRFSLKPSKAAADSTSNENMLKPKRVGLQRSTGSSGGSGSSAKADNKSSSETDSKKSLKKRSKSTEKQKPKASKSWETMYES